MGFTLLVLWLGALFSTIGIAASDFFCINLSTIATILGMSESLAGVTFLAFGNGSPDVFSTFAAFSTHSSSLAIGELFGAACFITAVVAGSMGIVRPFKVAKKAYMRDIAFFIAAAAFSLGFLYDGKLHLWECLAMVGFYVVYVVTVVVWHWFFARRKRRNERLAAARGQYVVHVTDEDQAEYRDEPDEDADTRPTLSRGTSREDFSLLERGNVLPGRDSEDDDEERDRLIAGLQSKMHLNRPGPGSRRNTINPIRPSLIGALEYKAFVSALQKSGSHQTIPLHHRRYSEDPEHPDVQADNLSSISDPQSRPPYYLSAPRDDRSPLLERPAPEVRSTTSGRSRAVSANDAVDLRPDFGFIERHATQNRQFLNVSTDLEGRLKPPSSVHSLPLDRIRDPPDLIVSEPDPIVNTNSFQDDDGNPFSFNLLAPPGEDGSCEQPRSSPNSPASQYRPKIHIPESARSSPTTPFPVYDDTLISPFGSGPPSIHLGPPSVSADSHGGLQLDAEDGEDNPVKWWPYSIAPPPKVLLYGIFPTLQHWRAKSWWERALATAAAPSIFLLTITLPVVEAGRHENIPEPVGTMDPSLTFQPYTDEPPIDTSKRALLSDSAEPSAQNQARTLDVVDEQPGRGSAAVAANIELSSATPLVTVQPASPSAAPMFPGPQPWHRWLTIMQLFLAPVFMVIVVYTQFLDPPDSFRIFIKPICFSLLGSLVLLIPLLLTTTPTHRPKAYETILSLAGFVVAIGWISTIANQVVAVLKALAVILNMSHAVMGLTIFACGNSLGDLVADITVANLGFPVMALSACFGGPMLNILLGIGLSGSWILIRGAEHRHKKHPGKQIKYRSYDIEVGTTLMISGVTLLFTLVALAVAVPLNKWKIDRKLGLCLIVLWVLSTGGNVLFVEVLGWGQDPGGEALGAAF